MRHFVLLAVCFAGACGTGTVTSGPPQIDSLEPAFGPAAGGTVVTIQGVGLAGLAGVRFGGALQPFAYDGTNLTFTTPEFNAGLVTVRLIGDTGGVSGAFTVDPGTWQGIDGGTATDGRNVDPAMAAVTPASVWHRDQLFVAWREQGATGTQIRTASRAGTTWTDQSGDHGLNLDPDEIAEAPQLVVFADRLYAAWRERNANGKYQVRAALWDESVATPAWRLVDGGAAPGLNRDPLEDANQVALATFGGHLYAAWSEDDGFFVGQIRVAVYGGDDAAPAWSFVDGSGVHGLNKNFAETAITPRLFEFAGRLHATWAEYVGGIAQVRVCRNDGTDIATDWQFVDGDQSIGLNVDATHQARTPAPFVVDDRLHVAWTEQDGSGEAQVRVAAFADATPPVWTIVDGGAGLNLDQAVSATEPQPLLVGRRLYLGWLEADGASRQVRLAAYGGDPAAPTWQFVDGGAVDGINRDPTHDARDLALALAGTEIVAVWAEANAASVYQVRAARAR